MSYDTFLFYMETNYKKVCGIYKIKNNLNGMSYCGQSVDCLERWNHHKRPSVNRTLIDKMINKYGVENFSFQIEKECLPEELDYYENETIKKYNTIFPNGYNLQSGGKNNFDTHEDTRRKRSENMKGDKNPTKRVEVRKKMSESAKNKPPMTDETKRKISESIKGRTLTEDARRKMSETKKDKPQPKYKYLTPSGEIREMSAHMVSHWHKDWIRLTEE